MTVHLVVRQVPKGVTYSAELVESYVTGLW
jgi:hypothetical protein